ncbi:MAG: prepilin-type N-terminal cleavage/methylation domain-containing protein [Desulfobacterales bacterium]
MEKHNKGFTLVEVLVAMAIVSIVMTVVYVVYASSLRSYTTQDVSAGVQQSIRVGVEYIAHDIRMAGYAPVKGDNFGIEEADASKIRLTRDTIDTSLATPDFNGVIDDDASERITYLFNPAIRRVSRILDEAKDTESAVILLDNVTALSFRYFDEAENDLGLPVPALNLEDIRGIDITLTIREPAGRGGPVERTLTQRVLCRNIGL